MSSVYPLDSIISLLSPLIMESIPQGLTRTIDLVLLQALAVSFPEDYLSTTPTRKSSLSVAVIVTLLPWLPKEKCILGALMEPWVLKERTRQELQSGFLKSTSITKRLLRFQLPMSFQLHLQKVVTSMLGAKDCSIFKNLMSDQKLPNNPR